MGYTLEDIMEIAAATFLLVCGIIFAVSCFKTAGNADKYLASNQQIHSSAVYGTEEKPVYTVSPSEVLTDCLASSIPIKIDGHSISVSKAHDGSITNIAAIKSLITKSEYIRYYEYSSDGTQTGLIFEGR